MTGDELKRIYCKDLVKNAFYPLNIEASKMNLDEQKGLKILQPDRCRISSLNRRISKANITR